MSQQILDNLKYFQPEIILTVTLCFALLVGVISKKGTIVGYISFVGILLATYLGINNGNGDVISIFNNMFAVDPFAGYFKFIIGLSTLIVIAFSFQSKELNTEKRSVSEYYSFLVALTLGMFLMAGASNLLMMYLALELSSLTSYLLAGYTRERTNSSEASLKYLLFGAVSSGMMLYGISLMYGMTGSVDIYGVNRALMTGDYNTIALLISGILITVGFGYKISAVPFHFWTPDVYEGAPITITALLSVASKAAGFAMMIRFFKVSFFDVSAPAMEGYWNIISQFNWNVILAIISVLTMTLGNLVAVWQTNLKRLLAYSSIAHAGYMLMGLVVLSNEGISAIMIYFMMYLFMNLGAFYVVMLIAQKTGSEDIDDYKGLAYRSPFISVVMVIFLIALTGLPPTAGFIGKLYIFISVIDARWYWLAVVGALNSVISLFYYVKIFRNMFLKQPEGDIIPIEFSMTQIVWLVLLVAPTIIFGLYFSPIVAYAQESVKLFQ
ncbi:MAG: NADH-quinone oxidoreductase subunit N [Bacteroidota bacterium]